MSDWKETAKTIAEEAWEECKDNENAAVEFIEESVDGCAEVIYTAEAYEVVCDARVHDYDTFETANDTLRDTEGDKIYEGESVDDIITRLAFCIIYTQAMEYYWELVNKHKEEEEEEDKEEEEEEDKEEVIIDD